MSDSPLRCPSCSGSLPTPRPATCPWCGGALPTIAAPAPARAPGPTGDARDLPRELPPLVEPRRGTGGCFVVALVLAVFFAMAVVFLTVRTGPSAMAPPPATQKSR